jgi:two-component system sensor histidine kinase BaeS
MGAGDPDVRAGDVGGSGELRALAASFDAMADTIAHQDQLRLELTSDLAHELRTPAAVLLSRHAAFADGIRKPTDAELASLYDQTQRLAWLIDDLQILSSSRQAQLRLEPTSLDLADLAADTVDTFGQQLDNAGLMLTLELDPAPVLADQRWIHQILTNLLSNALKYTPAGGQLTVRVSQHGDTARLQVSNTGPVIPPQELPHLFERYWRGSSAHSTHGSGIGLAVVARLVQAHHDQLSATSNPDDGTTITITLPIDTAGMTAANDSQTHALG